MVLAARIHLAVADSPGSAERTRQSDKAAVADIAVDIAAVPPDTVAAVACKLEADWTQFVELLVLEIAAVDSRTRAHHNLLVLRHTQAAHSQLVDCPLLPAAPVHLVAILLLQAPGR